MRRTILMLVLVLAQYKCISAQFSHKFVLFNVENYQTLISKFFEIR